MSDGRRDASEPASPARSAGARAWVSRRFDIFSPYDGTVVGRAPDIDFRTLVSSFDNGARAAGTLQSTQQVQKRLRVWAGKIDAQREELARVISLEGVLTTIKCPQRAAK
jgi:acyl-CoA reductase-like NAD-dependent aldehyde dehydrogenase